MKTSKDLVYFDIFSSENSLAHKKIKDRKTAKSVDENINDLKGKKKDLYLKKLQNIEAYQAKLDNDE